MADEYIRRDDALKALFAPGMCYAPMQLQIIKELPSADVAPVRHGKPITKTRTVTITDYHEARGVFAADGSNVYIKNMVHTEIPYDHCPVCGAALCSRWHNFCGKCGARMDGGDNGVSD